MTEPNQAYDPPQDTGAPDAAETDPVALNSAEDLDEDRLRVDPLEEGMDPPEHWSGVTKYGMTPWEQAHPRPLGERLAEERPDPAAEAPVPSEEDAAAQAYAEETGISADVAGGSMAAEFREDPDAESASRRPIQLEPVEGDGPPADTEPDQVGVDAGSAPAAGPEQAALHVEDASDR
jgi:hypothetical protein